MFSKSLCIFSACSLTCMAVTSVCIQHEPVSRPFTSRSGAIWALTTYCLASLRYLTISSVMLSPRCRAASMAARETRSALAPPISSPADFPSSSSAGYPLIAEKPGFTHSILPSSPNSRMPLLVRRVTSARRAITRRSRRERRLALRKSSSMGRKIVMAAAQTAAISTSTNSKGCHAICA